MPRVARTTEQRRLTHAGQRESGGGGADYDGSGGTTAAAQEGQQVPHVHGGPVDPARAPGRQAGGGAGAGGVDDDHGGPGPLPAGRDRGGGEGGAAPAGGLGFRPGAVGQRVAAVREARDRLGVVLDDRRAQLLRQIFRQIKPVGVGNRGGLVPEIAVDFDRNAVGFFRHVVSARLLRRPQAPVLHDPSPESFT